MHPHTTSMRSNILGSTRGSFASFWLDSDKAREPLRAMRMSGTSDLDPRDDPRVERMLSVDCRRCCFIRFMDSTLLLRCAGC
mmetsp:Transcript_38283/g.90543  ORF Transcript_38283/g.90543 Transcript_38283/m.90543 type:complete len:82 (+) Transcript_38283:2073-2318(+)